MRDLIEHFMCFLIAYAIAVSSIKLMQLCMGHL